MWLFHFPPGRQHGHEKKKTVMGQSRKNWKRGSEHRHPGFAGKVLAETRQKGTHEEKKQQRMDHYARGRNSWGGENDSKKKSGSSKTIGGRSKGRKGKKVGVTHLNS